MNGLTVADLTVDGPHAGTANLWVRGSVCDRCFDGLPVIAGICHRCAYGSTDSLVGG